MQAAGRLCHVMCPSFTVREHTHALYYACAHSKTMHSLFCITSEKLPYTTLSNIASRFVVPWNFRAALLCCRLAALSSRGCLLAIRWTYVSLPFFFFFFFLERVRQMNKGYYSTVQNRSLYCLAMSWGWR